jgi:hypothetical protein
VKGGEIVAEGTPEDVVKEKRSFTGQYLAPVLRGRDGKAAGKREASPILGSARWFVILDVLERFHASVLFQQ